MKDSTMMIDVDQLKQLLEIAQLRGTTDAWIVLALDWAESATKEAIRLRTELKKCEERCGGHQGG